MPGGWCQPRQHRGLWSRWPLRCVQFCSPGEDRKAREQELPGCHGRAGPAPHSDSEPEQRREDSRASRRAWRRGAGQPLCAPSAPEPQRTDGPTRPGFSSTAVSIPRQERTGLGSPVTARPGRASGTPPATAPCRPRRATLSDHREGGAGSRAALRGREGPDKAVTDEPRQRHARRRPWVSSPGQAGVGLLAKLSLSIASTKSVPPSKLGLPASPANAHVTAGDPAARNLGFQQHKGPLTQRPESGAPVGSRLSFSLPRGLPC